MTRPTEVIQRRARPSRRSLQGESPQGNTSNEETAPIRINVTDPGIPGRAFAQDSLKKCRTSKKLEQEC
uniref:Uncharacterized protein n=1 Tax=Oryza glumipatula TaxID=40148 RepID=A0A0E0B0W5_9ORYZ